MTKRKEFTGLDAAAVVEMMGRLAALEIVLRLFVKGAALQQPDPARWCNDYLSDLVVSVRARGNENGDPEMLVHFIEAQLTETFTSAARGVFEADVSRRATHQGGQA